MSVLNPQDNLEGRDPYELRVNQGTTVSESAVSAALKTGDMGFIHSFTTGSTVDGPGVRVVAWTSGCQCRCLYCHNPDTWNMMNGMPVTLDRAVEALKKYRHGLKAMGGGFTLSGGEPLMQDRFAVQLFTRARQMGIHCALDTNGFLGERLSDEELDNIDLFLLDIKTWDRQRHIELTAKDNEPTLNFARRLAARKKKTWLRYVLVPGFTDDEVDINHTAEFAGSLGVIDRVDVLPFHQMGRYKWKKLNLEYKLDDVQPPTPALVERVCQQFRSVGLTAY